MQAPRYTREIGTTFCFRFAANRNNMGKKLTRLEDVEHGLRFVLGNIHPDFTENFDRERIEHARFKPGALRVKEFPADLVEQRRRHLAPRAIVDANEQYFSFHIAKMDNWLIASCEQARFFRQQQITYSCLRNRHVHPNMG